MINAVSILNVCYMYVIFLIWQYPDIQVIAIHAFPKIYLDIKMSDLRQTTKIFDGFYKYTRQDECKLKNTALNLKQDKRKLYILKIKYLSDYKKKRFIFNKSLIFTQK